MAADAGGGDVLEELPVVAPAAAPAGRTFSVPQAAERLGMSVAAFYKRVNKGTGPTPIDRRGRRRFTAEAIAAFAEANPLGAGASRRRSRSRLSSPIPAVAEPASGIDWAAYQAYAPRVVVSLDGAEGWPAGVYLTPVGLLVRLPVAGAD